MLNCVDYNEWPKIEKYKRGNNFAIQINGKTRDIIKIKKDLSKRLLKKKYCMKQKQGNTC